MTTKSLWQGASSYLQKAVSKVGLNLWGHFLLEGLTLLSSTCSSVCSGLWPKTNNSQPAAPQLDTAPLLPSLPNAPGDNYYYTLALKELKEGKGLRVPAFLPTSRLLNDKSHSSPAGNYFFQLALDAEKAKLEKKSAGVAGDDILLYQTIKSRRGFYSNSQNLELEINPRLCSFSTHQVPSVPRSLRESIS